MTIYQRFLAAVTELTPAMARYLSSVDHCHRVALIAETDTEPIGVARYEVTKDPGSVELGLLVIDAWQNRGLGRILLAKTGHAYLRPVPRWFGTDTLRKASLRQYDDSVKACEYSCW